MKIFKKIFIVFLLLIIYVYICNITLLPNNIIIMQGENLNINPVLGLYLNSNNNIMQASSNLNNPINTVGKLDFKLDLFNLFPVKDISVNVIPKTKVVPIGASIGMNLYTDGVLVVGMSEIEGEEPFKNSGIKEGDRILEINDNKISNTNELINVVNESEGNNLNIKYVRGEEVETTSIKPVKNSNNEYKLGLWVRDAAAGVGTLTFYEPESGMFAALGHGIVDIDTSQIINIANGELVTTNILSITKGEKGTPGEIRGTIENGYTLGNIYKNTGFGVFGSLTNTSPLGINSNEAIDVALRNEIQLGKAEIICQLEDGKKEKYEIEIQKKFVNNNEDNKSMLIKITDDRLLEKTGGIIQGMSGAPIIQNGKFVGAVTHVLVNDPTVGYAVFGDIMIKQLH